jgi:hypothetical protein
MDNEFLKVNNTTAGTSTAATTHNHMWSKDTISADIQDSFNVNGEQTNCMVSFVGELLGMQNLFAIPNGTPSDFYTNKVSGGEPASYTLIALIHR